MSAYDPDDVAIMRQPARIATVTINIPSLVEIARAEIAAIPAYPAADYPVTNTSASWNSAGGIESQFVRVFDSTETTVKFEGILRRNVTASSVRIANRTDADTGVARFAVRPFSVGDVVVIYRARIPKAFLSRIDPVSAELLKRYDADFDTSGAYTAQTHYPKPQPNLGVHQHIVADPVTGVGRATLSRAGSFGWQFDISGVWELPAGMTLVSGYSVTDTTIEVDVLPGEYEYACRIEEDTSAQIKRGYRLLFCTDGVTVKAFSDRFAITAIEGDKQTRLGRSLTLTLKANRGTAIYEYLYTGAPVLLTTKHEYSGDHWQTVTIPSVSPVENYIGYVRKFDRIETDADGVDTYIVYCESPLQYYASLPLAAQTIIVNDPPTTWAEVHSSLAHVAFWVYYLLEYHAPVVLQLTDFDPGDFYLFKRYAFSSRGGELLAALKEAARLAGAGGTVGCLSSGQIMLRRHGCYESVPYRDAIATTWQLEPVDVREALQYSYDEIMPVGETTGSATVSGVTDTVDALKGRAGLYAQMQGVTKATLPAFIGISRADILDRIGHAHQLSNAPVKALAVDVGALDVIEPAAMTWTALSLSAVVPVELPARAISQEVARVWTFYEWGIEKRVTLTLEPETRGGQAEEVPIEPITTPIQPFFSGSECLTWTAVNQTPVGWETAGPINTLTWLGDTGIIAGLTWDVDYQVARLPGQNWAMHSVSQGGYAAGIRRIYSQPATVELIRIQSTANTLDWAEVMIAVENADGSYEVLANNRVGQGLKSFVEASWNGTRLVKTIYFLARSTGSRALTRSYINCDW